MELNETALLQILADHLKVTEKLLEAVIPVVSSTRTRSDFPAVPIFEQHPTLQELLGSTRGLREQVESILHP